MSSESKCTVRSGRYATDFLLPSASSNQRPIFVSLKPEFFILKGDCTQSQDHSTEFWSPSLLTRLYLKSTVSSLCGFFPYRTGLLSMKVSGLFYSLSNLQTFFYENWSSTPHLSWSRHVRLIGPSDQLLIQWSYVTITFIALLGIDHDTQDGWNGPGQKLTWNTGHLAAILETSRPWGDSRTRHHFFISSARSVLVRQSLRPSCVGDSTH